MESRLIGGPQLHFSLGPEPMPNPSCSKAMDTSPARKDFRTPFYEHYRKEAEEYDKEFMQRHGEDLNTALIFVRQERDSMNVR